MKYYKTDSRKVSFREYFNISRRGFLLAWLLKILGIPLKLTHGIPEPQPLRHSIIEAAAIPPGMLARLQSGILDFEKIGFGQFWFYTLKNSLIGGTSYGVHALHSKRKTVGKIIYSSFSGRESFLYVFLSELSDGEILASSNHKPQFKPPPKHTVSRLIGANAAELLELHQKKLARSDSNPPKTIGNLDQLAMFDDKVTRLAFEDKVARGIWVEMSNAEVEALRARR